LFEAIFIRHPESEAEEPYKGRSMAKREPID